MSCTSSPSHSAFGEPTIFVLQDRRCVLPSDATGGRTSPADASHYGRTFAPGNGSPVYSRAVNIGANLDFPVNNAIIEEIANCFAEESNETYSYAPYHPSDKDWLLCNNSNEALPIIDSDFSEDADACVDSPAAASYTPAANVAEDDEDISLDDVSSYDHTEHIDEALDDFEIRSHADYIPAEFSQSIHQETLLQHWQYDYQRHEWVALKFQQPPYTTKPYSVPYTTEHQ